MLEELLKEGDMVENPGDTYTRTYKLRTTGQRARTIEVSVPRDVIIRLSRKVGLTIDQYIEQYRAVAHYSDLDGVIYYFEKYEGDGAGSKGN